jgi:hypothetical protein
MQDGHPHSLYEPLVMEMSDAINCHSEIATAKEGQVLINGH